MRKRSYSMREFAEAMEMGDIQALMNQQRRLFSERFGLGLSKDIAVTLVFDNHYDTNDFYNEIRFNPDYQQLYSVSYNNDLANSLIVKGQCTLFDYFGTKEPNLLTISRDLELKFAIDFVQDYSGTTFKGEVMNGELLARQCILEVSDVLPELTLGCLGQIARSFNEFDLLLTRVYAVSGEMLI